MTLLEVTMALAIFAIAAMMLMAAMASERESDALARERIAATQAIRAYIETMRQTYPTTSTSTDMTGFLCDTRTPVNFLPSPTNAGDTTTKSILLDAQALVLKGTFEAGDKWGPAAYSSGWMWTDATMTGVGVVSSTVTTQSRVATFNGGTGLDLDGDGVVNASGSATIAPASVIRVPCEITLSWRTAANPQPTAIASTPYQRQRITVYAVFSPQH